MSMKTTLPVLLVLVLGVYDAHGQDVGTRTDSVSVTSGLELYRQMYCGLCHALEKAGTRGIFGPSHDGMAEIAEQRVKDPNYAGEAKTAEEYVRESIVQPALYIAPGFETTVHRMPAYTHLSDEDVYAIVQFLIADE